MGSVSIRKLTKKTKMKLACVLAATATASIFEESDRKFSDKPEWIADEIWDTWGDKSPAYRVGQLKCRVNMFVDALFADAAESTQNNIKKNWEGVAVSIEKAFTKCTGEAVETNVNCGWRGWLDDEDKTIDNKVHSFVSWNGVAVRETVFKGGCEARAMKIFKRLDRMNAYLQWNYCKKVETSPNFCNWRFNNNLKQNSHPRSDSRGHGISKFDA